MLNWKRNQKLLHLVIRAEEKKFAVTYVLMMVCLKHPKVLFVTIELVFLSVEHPESNFFYKAELSTLHGADSHIL